MRFPKIKRSHIFISVVLFALLFYWVSLPAKLFNKPISTVVLSEDGRLLGARVATDGQWRFPQIDTIPYKFKESILLFEDEYFYYHPGVNPVSIFRAAVQNIKARSIVSGGSTLSMQLIRLSKDNPKRTVFQKIKETILATRLELEYSKNEILRMYVSNAPFGGNVVGLEAASWRYFGRPSKKLSWAESALLAVLPNAPSLIYPGKNEHKLKAKRDRLLKKLYENNKIDSLTFSLSVIEPLPVKVKSLPNISPHLLDFISTTSLTKQYKTTINYALQKEVNRIVEGYAKKFRANKIYNAAVLIVENNTGNVVAYIGNTKGNKENDKGNFVDVIMANRSSGSILKPFLYAFMIQEGKILPKTLIDDIPTEISGYNPENFDRQYDGVVPADEALQRSLNIPAVKMLQQYGYPKFHSRLKSLGFSTINRSSDNYGLSLILGGAEVKLWELAGVYSSMARVLNNSHIRDYDISDWRMPNVIGKEYKLKGEKVLLDAASIWFTFDAMQNLTRPQNESGWNLFSSSRKVAWKTGTSHGYRDAWSVGVDSKYCVAVWVGNADGEGRPEMTGINTASPLMFSVFDCLPETPWFQIPDIEMKMTGICSQSGYRANKYCTDVIEENIHNNGLNTRLCPFHKLIHLDSNGHYQVTGNCESVGNMTHKKMFVLPPAQAWFYKKTHHDYLSPPPYRPGCYPSEEHIMQMIYPKYGTKVFIPIEAGVGRSGVVCEMTHKQDNIKVYWHLNGKYLGNTTSEHQMLISPEKGKHTLILTDENGSSIIVNFEVVN